MRSIRPIPRKTHHRHIHRLARRIVSIHHHRRKIEPAAIEMPRIRTSFATGEARHIGPDRTRCSPSRPSSSQTDARPDCRRHRACQPYPHTAPAIPAFCALVAPLAGPPAASDRTTGFVLEHAAFCGPPNILLIAFAADHSRPAARRPSPHPARPNHHLRRQRRIKQPRRIHQRIVAHPPAPSQSSAHRQSPPPHTHAPFEQCRTLTPAAVDTYQSDGFAGSIATVPPSPAEICDHAPPQLPPLRRRRPIRPQPHQQRRRDPSDARAKLTTSASDPNPPFRF